MKKVYQHTKQRWLTITLFILLFSFIPLVLEYWFTKLSPVTNWFEYSAVYVAEESVCCTDQVITVLSYAVIKRPVQMQWNDVLYCDGKDDGFRFVTSNQSSNYFQNPTILPRVFINPNTGAESNVPWQFNINTQLIAGQTCYIESIITAQLPFGIQKSQQIRSNNFVIQ